MDSNTNTNLSYAYLDAGKLYMSSRGDSPKAIDSDFVLGLEERRAADSQRTAWQQGSQSWNLSACGSATPFGAPPNEFCGDQPIVFSSLHRSPNGFSYIVNAGTVSALLEFDPSDNTERRIKHAHSPFAAYVAQAPGDVYAMSLRSDEGKSHIAIAQGSFNSAETLTAGDVLDDAPSFHPKNPDHVYYHSSGIGRDVNGVPVGLGPSRVERLDIESNTTTTCIDDEHHDYLAPKVLSDDTILCLRRPWELNRPPSVIQSLKETLLIPIALIRVLITVAHSISMMLSNKPVLPGYMQDRQAGRRNNAVMLWNRVVELGQRNSKKSEDTIVSSDWTLVRIENPGSEPSVHEVAKHVVAFDTTADGSIIYSTGKKLWHLDGDQSKLLAKGTMINEIAIMS